MASWFQRPSIQHPGAKGGKTSSSDDGAADGFPRAQDWRKAHGHGRAQESDQSMGLIPRMLSKVCRADEVCLTRHPPCIKDIQFCNYLQTGATFDPQTVESMVTRRQTAGNVKRCLAEEEQARRHDEEFRGARATTAKSCRCCSTQLDSHSSS